MKTINCLHYSKKNITENYITAYNIQMVQFLLCTVLLLLLTKLLISNLSEPSQLIRRKTKIIQYVYVDLQIRP